MTINHVMIAKSLEKQTLCKVHPPTCRIALLNEFWAPLWLGVQLVSFDKILGATRWRFCIWYRTSSNQSSTGGWTRVSQPEGVTLLLTYLIYLYTTSHTDIWKRNVLFFRGSSLFLIPLFWRSWDKRVIHTPFRFALLCLLKVFLPTVPKQDLPQCWNAFLWLVSPGDFHSQEKPILRQIKWIVNSIQAVSSFLMIMLRPICGTVQYMA